MMVQACKPDVPSPVQQPEPAPAESGTLTLLFDDIDAAEFSDDEKRLINDVIRQAEREVRALLPALPDRIEVTVVTIDRNIDIVGGVTGRAYAPGKVLLEVSETYPGGVMAAAQAALEGSVYHEFHHLARGWTIEGNRYGPGIAIAAVNEGLASVFSENYTGIYFEAANAYPEEAEAWLQEIVSLPADADYGTWMFQHPDGRTAIGYRIGRYIVHRAAANSGLDVLELSDMSPGDILDLAGAPGSP